MGIGLSKRFRWSSQMLSPNSERDSVWRRECSILAWLLPYRKAGRYEESHCKAYWGAISWKNSIRLSWKNTRLRRHLENHCKYTTVTLLTSLLPTITNRKSISGNSKPLELTKFVIYDDFLSSTIRDTNNAYSTEPKKSLACSIQTKWAIPLFLPTTASVKRVTNNWHKSDHSQFSVTNLNRGNNELIDVRNLNFD